MIVEVIRTNVKLFFFFLQENFISIKSKKSIKNIYKQISDFLKHKTLNKQLSLRCFYEHKKHKTLFTSIKSYAQDAVYQHKMSFVSTRCCLWAQMSTKWCTKMLFMSTDEHRWVQMMHTDVVYEHRWCTRWAQDVVYEHKMLFMSTKSIKSNFFFLSCFLLAQNVKQANKMFLWA